MNGQLELRIITQPYSAVYITDFPIGYVKKIIALLALFQFCPKHLNRFSRHN